MTRIAVIDHGAGNLVSIQRALEVVGGEPRIAEGPADLRGVEAVILPGVGATGAAMARLDEQGLVEPLQQWDGPLLGICVGMQLLFDSSDEDGGACLGVVPGSVQAISGRPLPHMGWNDVWTSDDPLFDGVTSGSLFTFVHSFAAVPDDPSIVTATSDHGGRFVAAIRDRNYLGLQFHPERSGASGLRVLENFVGEARRAA
ncbi:MAG: imidazole glycerol phosphate synthase subunit HisH [Acidimicrobiia bacterium]